MPLPATEEIARIASETIAKELANFPALELSPPQRTFAELMFIAGARWLLSVEEVAHAR